MTVSTDAPHRAPFRPSTSNKLYSKYAFINQPESNDFIAAIENVNAAVSESCRRDRATLSPSSVIIVKRFTTHRS